MSVKPDSVTINLTPDTISKVREAFEILWKKGYEHTCVNGKYLQGHEYGVVDDTLKPRSFKRQLEFFLWGINYYTKFKGKKFELVDFYTDVNSNDIVKSKNRIKRIKNTHVKTRTIVVLRSNANFIKYVGRNILPTTEYINNENCLRTILRLHKI